MVKVSSAPVSESSQCTIPNPLSSQLENLTKTTLVSPEIPIKTIYTTESFCEPTKFLGAGKCIVEFEKEGTAVMEDVGTFMITVLRLGDTSDQVAKY